jgi:hypothetical protein
VIFNDFVGITTSETEARAGLASIKSPPQVSRPPAAYTPLPMLHMTHGTPLFSIGSRLDHTPSTVPKAKRRAEEECSEEQDSIMAADEYVVHRVPEHYDSSEAPQTGPFCVDAASSSNPLVGYM